MISLRSITASIPSSCTYTAKPKQHSQNFQAWKLQGTVFKEALEQKYHYTVNSSKCSRVLVHTETASLRLKPKQHSQNSRTYKSEHAVDMTPGRQYTGYQATNTFILSDWLSLDRVNERIVGALVGHTRIRIVCMSDFATTQNVNMTIVRPCEKNRVLRNQALVVGILRNGDVLTL